MICSEIDYFFKVGDPELHAKGNYKGMFYLVISNGMGCFPLCYIGIPSNNLFYHIDFSDRHNLSVQEINKNVHGGITWDDENLPNPYSLHSGDRKWIGWDYAHVGDYTGNQINGKQWKVSEVVEEAKQVIDVIMIEQYKLMNAIYSYLGAPNYKGICV